MMKPIEQIISQTGITWAEVSLWSMCQGARKYAEKTLRLKPEDRITAEHYRRAARKEQHWADWLAFHIAAYYEGVGRKDRYALVMSTDDRSKRDSMTEVKALTQAQKFKIAQSIQIEAHKEQAACHGRFTTAQQYGLVKTLESERLRVRAAIFYAGFSRKQRLELLAPVQMDYLLCDAAIHTPGLTQKDRAMIVARIDLPEYRRMAADGIKGYLTPEH